MNVPTAPADDRQDLHNASVSEEAAAAGRCGQVHLPSGRTCTLEVGHPGSCGFVPPDQVEESLTLSRRWRRVTPPGRRLDS
jgi:hypothetical protein